MRIHRFDIFHFFQLTILARFISLIKFRFLQINFVPFLQLKKTYFHAFIDLFYCNSYFWAFLASI